ncbi:hypothetical protein Tco_0339205 [Tanacetum coccineum]
MHGDETPDAYLNHAQDADALTAIGEPVKDKDLVILVVSCLREEYNGLKTKITARKIPTAFSELHALLSDHDYMLGKTYAPAASITSSFAANYAVGSPSMPEARQAQLLELTTQLSAFGFQVSPIAPSSPQAFYGARPSNNNRNTGANSHVTPDLEAMENSEAYYGDDALHVGNSKGLPILHIDEPLALPLDEIQIDDKLNFIEEPVEIMDREVKRLKQSRIPIVKVRWNSRRGPEFTWEREDQMKKKYNLIPTFSNGSFSLTGKKETDFVSRSTITQMVSKPSDDLGSLVIKSIVILSHFYSGIAGCTNSPDGL